MVGTRSLLSNIASLTSLQAINFALTLIVLPVLTRRLGLDAFGELVFAQLIINYMIWVVNWGFYLGATQRISANRFDNQLISQIFASTWYAQFILTGIILLGYLTAVSYLPHFLDNYDLYLSGLLLIIGNILMPLWFLNGLEMIKLATVLQIGSKIVALPFVFFVVSDAGDGWIYLGALALGMVLMGSITLWTIFRRLAIRLTRPDMSSIISALRGDLPLFLSSIVANLNTTLIPAVLGATGSVAGLAIYNLADRARGAASTGLSPITHALFPRMCYLFANDQRSAIKALWITGLVMLVITSTIAALLIIFSQPVMLALGGEEFEGSVSVIQILALSPIFGVMASFMIHQILIPNSRYKAYQYTMFLALGVSGALAWPAITGFGAVGGAAVVVFTEVLMCVVLIRYVLRHGLTRVMPDPPETTK